MVTHKVRVLRSGNPVTVVHIDDYQIACGWAYDYMRLQKVLDASGMWAAVLETGVIWYDPIGSDRDIFVPDGALKEGLVLDKKLLQDPSVDMKVLFGQQ